MNCRALLIGLTATVAVAAARQSVPAEVLKRAERARVSGVIVAWCQGEFRSGRPGDIAAAVTGTGGGGR